MRKIIIVLFFTVINIINIYGRGYTCNIDVDSLFTTNIMYLKKLVEGSSEGVVVRDKNCVEFLYILALFDNKSPVECPNGHYFVANSKGIEALEDWYQKKKKYITSEKIKKARDLLFPPMFTTMEEFDKWSEELDQLEIKDE